MYVHIKNLQALFFNLIIAFVRNVVLVQYEFSETFIAL